jgi:group I intron endonuclease
MMPEIIAGIYEIRNVVNGKRYIGSAVNIRTRWMDHKKLLRRGNHHCKHLQNSWNKHGEKAFLFTILERVDKKENLIPLEQEYIDTLMPEYNTAKKAGSTLGVPCLESTKRAVGEASRKRIITDEYRQKMSSVKKGVPFTDEHKRNISEGRRAYLAAGNKNGNERTVQQYTLDGIFVREFESVTLAEQATGLKGTHISRCARGKRGATGGFIWKYADGSSPEYISRADLQKKSVSQYSLDMELVATFSSQVEAFKATGTRAESICMCCKGKLKTAGGYIWRYADDKGT